jgi:PqqD family protein of HPr-rel-A system
MKHAASNSNSRQAQMKWQAIAGHALHVRSWDDEFVVYNSLSGDTHLLGAGAGQILMRLQHAPADEASLTTLLCETFHAEPGPELSLQVGTMLADLHRLSLIEGDA